MKPTRQAGHADELEARWPPRRTDQQVGNLVLLVRTAALAAARWPVLRRPAALLPACLVLATGIEALPYLLPRAGSCRSSTPG